jgi:hypothetical protein
MLDDLRISPREGSDKPQPGQYLGVILRGMIEYYPAPSEFGYINRKMSQGDSLRIIAACGKRNGPNQVRRPVAPEGCILCCGEPEGLLNAFTQHFPRNLL